MMVSTPVKIWEDLNNNIIDRFTAFKSLIALLEKSDNSEYRLEAIKYLEKIEVLNDNLFKILENLLISDENNTIRNIAAQFIGKKFLHQAINPLKWAIKYENDFNCLITIIKLLGKLKNKESKLILYNEIKKILKRKYLNKERKIENTKFKKTLKKLMKQKNYEEFTHEEFVEILINYLTTSNLFTQYYNVYFELDSENGLLKELDLSDYLEYEVKGTPFGWKNNIKSISEIVGLKYLKYLKKIDLSNNQIENIQELVNLENLTHLILTNNKISNIENLENIKKLQNLEYLDLRNNDVVKKIHSNEFNPRMRVLLKDSYIKIK